MKIAVYESLQDVPSSILPHFSFASLGNFFLSTEWFQCLYETVMRPTHAMRVYVPSNDGLAPTGLAVCCCPRSTSDLRGLTNYYTGEYQALIRAPGAALGQLPAFIGFLAAERPRWRSLDFDYLRSDKPDAAEISSTLGAAGFSVERAHRYENWFLPVRGMDFRSFYEARPSQMRNTVMRREKKLLKAHRVDIRLVSKPTDDLERAIADYVAIYNSSWKKEEPHPAFIPTLVQTCAALGILRLGILTVDSVPAAAQLWIVHGGGTAIIYKLAYDERFADFSVGSILSRELFKNAFEMDKVCEIDYGVGSERYKRDWMTDVRHFERVSALNLRHPAGFASACVSMGKRVLKTVLRSRRAADLSHSKH